MALKILDKWINLCYYLVEAAHAMGSAKGAMRWANAPKTGRQGQFRQQQRTVDIPNKHNPSTYQ